MVKIYRGEINPIDLVAVGRSAATRTAVTPWQMDGLGLVRYLGAAVPWKGVKGREAVKAFVAPYGKLAVGIETIASKAATVKGVLGAALGTISGKDYKGRPYTKRGLVPKRCFEIAKAHGKSVAIEREAAHYPAVIKPVPVPTVVVPIPV